MSAQGIAVEAGLEEDQRRDWDWPRNHSDSRQVFEWFLLTVVPHRDNEVAKYAGRLKSTEYSVADRKGFLCVLLLDPKIPFFLKDLCNLSMIF